MTTGEVLRKARELFLDGKHRKAGMVMIHNIIHFAANGDFDAASLAMEALDAAVPTPGIPFCLWVDGVKVTEHEDGRIEFTYSYDRRPAEIAAVIGKAAVAANRVEARA